MTPHFDSVIGDGQSVEYALLGRAIGYEDQGSVKVYSPSSGVIIVKFFPDMDGVDFPISIGSGNVLKFNMDVVASPPSPATTPVQFVTLNYDYNLFADVYGNSAIQPEIVNGTFTVTYPPPPSSCPVLFTYDGQNFVKEDVLLTACEKSDYRDVVTDYYQLNTNPLVQNDKVRFQLREMEDEITYLDDVRLITVDHDINTKVACDVSGKVFSYSSEPLSPFSAFDNNDIDRLSEIIAEDGITFVSDEAGYLIATFPNTENSGGYELNAAEKLPCEMDKPAVEDGSTLSKGVKVEYRNDLGEWKEFPALPARENSSNEIVIAPDEPISSGVMTIRISWDHGYSADVIRRLSPANENLLVKNYQAIDFALSTPHRSSKWSGFGEGSTLTLQKGETIDFSFETEMLQDQSKKRDYIIQATGRYEPNYYVSNQLLPSTVRLFNNYPNPFNPSTTISYALPKAGKVRLEVFNILGQSVAVLVDGHQDAGMHQAEWNSKDNSSLASGLYMYRLTVGDFSETKKMLLVK